MKQLIKNHHSLLTTHYSPLTTHHSLLTTHYSPLTTHHSLLTTHYCFYKRPHSIQRGIRVHAMAEVDDMVAAKSL